MLIEGDLYQYSYGNLWYFSGGIQTPHTPSGSALRGYKTTAHTIIVDEEMIYDLNIKDIHLVQVLVQLSECNGRACPTIIAPANSRSDVMFWDLPFMTGLIHN